MPGQLRTKPLSIAAVGMTVDGREITEQDVADIVETYNPRKYGARINLDHEFNWSGWAAKNLHNVDIPGMLGDVESVEAYENEEGVVCLYAVLAPNQSFVQLNKADQAVYFSIEISRDFMGSGKTYLTGLAVTDYPASCYTDRIHFSSKSKADDTEVALLTVDLGSCEPIDTPKKPFFKRLFAKEESDMNETQLANALKDALGTPLSEFGQKLDGLTAKLDSFSTTNVEAEDETTPPAEESAELTKLKEELSSTKTALDELNDKFAKALKAPAGDTTDADDEPEGDEGKYSQLL
ncbi:GPO family capsid scaffolding protein [Pseudoalteromonas sp. HL-AS1]|uniref:GPO family capsid scaffolding protein n=1 Tax=Pseudoalteromonas sp. HL-AS1 TaxID=3071081 RepID=UPI002815F2A9|nr:GPO family capsid scaffolding protein [Pseudoalteromonas sp. HL-AS1]WMS91377.1 GPO family capsid scaffolding protein [Pseudoalteromonas sp. HL-AS1]WMT83677.1 prohead protease/scaffold [Pseudoalteromonas phage ACA1]WMT83729.1 prohead protease/scaffold [Pseudoalteromonas phage ACA2]WMT83781.1 prohead protease/scaffold [Pseudoalteromonas phage proACA1-A]